MTSRIGLSEMLPTAMSDAENFIRSLSASGFEEVKVRAVSRSFIVSSGIKALAITTSRYGITYKDLICTLRGGSYVPFAEFPARAQILTI